MGKAIQEFFLRMGWFVSEPMAVCIFCGGLILILLILLLIIRSVRNSRKIKELEQKNRKNSDRPDEKQ